MEIHEEKFENYFQFLSARKKWDTPKAQDTKRTSAGYPNMYCIYILNNNDTPSDFLISLIKKFFHKNTSQAIKTAMEIDKEGRALCNIYTRDTAETKVMQVLEYAQAEQQDVKCIMQKRSDQNVIKKS